MKCAGLSEAFLLLVLDEINSQPNLRSEFAQNEMQGVAIKLFGMGLDQAVQTLEKQCTGLPVSVLRMTNTKVSDVIIPRPKKLTRDVAEVLSMVMGSNYDALCRSAILHIYWNELTDAERKINMAKNNDDSKAFAHHVYGLLRGVQGNRDGARFELGIALERESFEGARHRIKRAITVCDSPFQNK